ncbi:MAG: hypothetical protein ACRDQ7_02065 [Haloechinothrix sp.]
MLVTSLLLGLVVAVMALYGLRKLHRRVRDDAGAFEAFLDEHPRLRAPAALRLVTATESAPTADPSLRRAALGGAVAAALAAGGAVLISWTGPEHRDALPGPDQELEFTRSQRSAIDAPTPTRRKTITIHRPSAETSARATIRTTEGQRPTSAPAARTPTTTTTTTGQPPRQQQPRPRRLSRTPRTSQMATPTLVGRPPSSNCPNPRWADDERRLSRGLA